MVSQKFPQGALDLCATLNRLAGFEAATDRNEGEKAWRSLCGLILEGRIHPYALTGSGESYELARDQFAGLGERYIFVATEPLRYRSQGECLLLKFEGLALSKWRDTHARLVTGRLFFFERDLRTVLTLNDRKRTAVIEAFETLGRDNLNKLLQKDREDQVIKQVKDICNLKVSDRYVRKLWSGI